MKISKKEKKIVSKVMDTLFIHSKLIDQTGFSQNGNICQQFTYFVRIPKLYKQINVGQAGDQQYLLQQAWRRYHLALKHVAQFYALSVSFQLWALDLQLVSGHAGVVPVSPLS